MFTRKGGLHRFIILKKKKLCEMSIFDEKNKIFVRGIPLYRVFPGEITHVSQNIDVILNFMNVIKLS